MTTTTETYSVKAWKADQSLHGEMLAEADGARYRARVRRNAYDSQSFAVAERWTDAAGWENVTTRPFASTRICSFSYVERDEQEWREAIALDLLELIEEATGFFA